MLTDSITIAIATMQASRLASIEPPRPPLRAVSQPVQSTLSNSFYEEINEEINVDTLVKVPPEDIQSFRNYLRGIPFCYNDIIPTVLGRHLDTEGDVRLFFDSSIVLAVWPVALAMPPTIRAADLVLTSEKLYNSSRPNISVLAYSGQLPTTAVAQIEIKGPQGLAVFRPVIQSILDHRVIVQPVDWTLVTRQLRKYAQDTPSVALFSVLMASTLMSLFSLPTNRRRLFTSFGAGAIVLDI
jgi:hypothetical protein